MPWNDNSKPGPWGAPPSGDKPAADADGSSRPKDEGRADSPRPGPKSPWGAPPSGRPNGGGGSGGGGSGGGQGPLKPKRPLGPGSGPRRNPELEALAARVRDRARRFFRNPNGEGVRPQAVAAVAGLAFGLWLLSGVYIVQPDEEAVITRFGAYARSEGPGLKIRLPSPIERVERVSVTSLNRINIGAASGPAAEQSLMLTGDENIVQMNFAVLWRVRDADNFLFRVADPEGTVEMVAESAMREVVGRTPFQSVVSTGRGRVQTQAAELMQAILNQYGAGVAIVEVQIVGAEPPREVIDAFRDVARAGQNAEASVNEANTYRNRVVNEAVGDAAAIRQQAEGYRERVVREAEGAAARFNQVFTEYRAAPGVTRERLYLETMERVLRESNKIVVDGNGNTNTPIILPADVFRQRQPQGAPAGAQPPATGPTTAAQPQVSAAPGAAR